MKRNILLAILMTIVVSANAMSLREARIVARDITDKMAYELRLTNRQYHEVYDINLRYIDNPVRKDRALYRVLSVRQYERYVHHRHLFDRPRPHAVAPHHRPAPAPHKAGGPHHRRP